MSKKIDQPNPAPESAPTGPTSPKKTFRDLVSGAKFQDELALCLPKHITADRYVRVLMTATLRQPMLMECTQESLFFAIFNAAQVGLEIDGREAHLVPFRNNKKKGNPLEAQLIVDYKGYVKLMYNGGFVTAVHADVVCDKDEFEFDRGEVLHHRIDLRSPRGDPYAVWCMLKLSTGEVKYEVMSAEQVRSVRMRSKAWNSGPWVTDPEEMWKKTVLKRAQKWVPVAPEVRKVMQAEDRADPVNVTPAKQSFAGLIGAPQADATATMDPSVPPPPTIDQQPPAEVPTYTPEQREAILREVQDIMLDRGVKESRIMVYVHTEGLAEDGQDEVATLSTHVLDGLRAVIPTLAAPREDKKP